MFMKLPVDALEIRTEAEKNNIKRKACLYIIFDLLLLVAVITVLVTSKDEDCKFDNEKPCW